jgi:hypothetical protein
MIPTLQNLLGNPFCEIISSIFSERNEVVPAFIINLEWV